jgi:hypothetical protein
LVGRGKVGSKCDGWEWLKADEVAHGRGASLKKSDGSGKRGTFSLRLCAPSARASRFKRQTTQHARAATRAPAAALVNAI